MSNNLVMTDFIRAGGVLVKFDSDLFYFLIDNLTFYSTIFINFELRFMLCSSINSRIQRK